MLSLRVRLFCFARVQAAAAVLAGRGVGVRLQLAQASHSLGLRDGSAGEPSLMPPKTKMPSNKMVHQVYDNSKNVGTRGAVIIRQRLDP